jgi:hypothetical protein
MGNIRVVVSMHTIENCTFIRRTFGAAGWEEVLILFLRCLIHWIRVGRRATGWPYTIHRLVAACGSTYVFPCRPHIPAYIYVYMINSRLHQKRYKGPSSTLGPATRDRSSIRRAISIVYWVQADDALRMHDTYKH